MAKTLQDSDNTVPLTIFTDCLLLLDMATRWKRADFAPRCEDENHPDILENIIQTLSHRNNNTCIIWVAAHRGDPGNEAADVAANEGTLKEEAEWHTQTDPIRLYSITSTGFPTLHNACWTKQVESHARRTIGGHVSARIRQNSEAKSTEMATREDTGGHTIGKVMMDKQIPEKAIRDLLQSRGFAFPTGTTLDRNRSANKTRTRCPLCKLKDDTHCHRTMECREVKDARQKMHNEIAEALITTMAKEQQRLKPKPEVEKFVEKQVEILWPNSPAGLRHFQPDRVLWVREPPKSTRRSRIIIIEFTRTYTIMEKEMKEAQAIKRNAYHNLVTHLKEKTQGTGTVIEMCPLAMSTLALVPRQTWEETITQTGIEADRVDKVIEAGFKACIIAGHQLNNTYRSRMEEIRMNQAAAARRKGIG